MNILHLQNLNLNFKYLTMKCRIFLFKRIPLKVLKYYEAKKSFKYDAFLAVNFAKFSFIDLITKEKSVPNKINNFAFQVKIINFFKLYRPYGIEK